MQFILIEHGQPIIYAEALGQDAHDSVNLLSGVHVRLWLWHTRQLVGSKLRHA